MKTIRYFCTGGYTEVGGIDWFLKKINPSVHWKREFPAISKPGAKPPRPNSDHPVPSPIAIHNGVTGAKLIEAMKDHLSTYPANYDFDGILLIDDADCRFNSSSSFQQWIDKLTIQIQQLTDSSKSFYVLLASPEIEAWLLSDWNNSIRIEYGDYFSHKFKSHISNCINSTFPWDTIENFGLPLINDSCSVKLSSVIQNEFSNVAFMSQFLHLKALTDNKLQYSKTINGGAMLKRIDPSVVANYCKLYFAETYQKLASL